MLTNAERALNYNNGFAIGQTDALNGRPWNPDRSWDNATAGGYDDGFARPVARVFRPFRRECAA